MYKVFLYGVELRSPIFKTKEDAELYISFCGDGDHYVQEVEVFQKKYFHSLNPYVAWFDHDTKTFIGVVKRIPDNVFGMLENKTIIRRFSLTTDMVAFWDAGDLQRAEVLAKSIYDGWIAGGGNETV